MDMLDVKKEFEANRQVQSLNGMRFSKEGTMYVGNWLRVGNAPATQKKAGRLDIDANCINESTCLIIDESYNRTRAYFVSPLTACLLLYGHAWDLRMSEVLPLIATNKRLFTFGDITIINWAMPDLETVRTAAFNLHADVSRILTDMDADALRRVFAVDQDVARAAIIQHHWEECRWEGYKAAANKVWRVTVEESEKIKRLCRYLMFVEHLKKHDCYGLYVRHSDVIRAYLDGCWTTPSQPTK